MTRDQIIQGFTERAQNDLRVAALFLGGSLGSGRGDLWSDVDLILVVHPQHHTALVTALKSWATGVADIVLWRQIYPGIPLFMAVTAEWLRFDLTVTVPTRIIGAQSTLRPLVDHAQVWSSLPPSLPHKPVDPAHLAVLVEETLRILGLTPVAVGRGEYANMVTGVGLLRQQLISLMIAETEPPLPPGALHLKRILPQQDIEILEALPAVVATPESAIAATLIYAQLFLPRAKALADKIGTPWPSALEAATRAHLGRELGLELPTSL